MSFPADTTLTGPTASIPAVPAYLVPVIDPTWGTTVTRVSNIAGVRHAYSRVPGWNSDGSKILLGFTFPGRMIDGETYEDLGSFSQINGAIWASTDNNKLFGWASGGTILYSQNATTGSLTSLHDFAGDGYSAITIGNYEGAVDDNDDYVALLGTITTHTWLIVYRISTDTITATKDLGTGSVDNCSISRLGGYVVVVGSGVGGTRVWPASLSGSGTLLTSAANHGDCALNAASAEIYVTNNAATGYVVSYLLSTGVGTNLFGTTSTAFEYGHTSGRNTDRPGWVYLSVYDYTATSGRPGRDQLVAVKTDGSGTVEVFGFSNNHTSGSTYAGQAHAVPSRDGSKVLFASRRDASSAYAYVAEQLGSGGVGGEGSGGGPAGSVVQQGVIAQGGTTATFDMDEDPGVGNLIVLVTGWRDAVPQSIPTGFTQVGSSVAAGDGLAMSYRIAQPGDTKTIVYPTISSKEHTTVWVELAGAWPANPVDVTDDDTGSGIAPSVSITPTDGANGVVIGGAENSNNNTPQDTDYVAGTGWTLIDEANVPSGHPVVGAVLKIVPDASGSYSPNLIATSGYPGDGSLSQWGMIAAFFATAPPDPEPGVVIGAEDPDDILAGDDSGLLPLGDIVSWVITRGASPEITGGANPGSAVVTVQRKNRDGLYNPRNVDSPLYGFLRDGVRVWIGVNDDGTLTPGGTVKGLFAGRITDISVLPDAGPDHAIVTEIACEDPLAWYGRTPVHVADSRTRSHRELRLAVLAAIGETRFTLDNEIGTMPISAADGTAFDVLGRINAANGTRHFAKPSDSATDWYRYTTYNRNHKLAGVADASIDAASDHVTGIDGWRLSADTVINQQRAAVDAIEFLDGARIVWTHDALPLKVQGTVVVWATLPDYVDGQTVEYTFSGTTPTVTITPFGRTAKLTLVSAGTTTFRSLRIRGVEVLRGDEQSFVADDLTSQLPPRFIRAGSDISGEYVGVLAMARGIAQHVVWRYGNPQMRPTLTVENWFPEQFELDLYDVISLTSSHFAADEMLFEIVGLTHRSDVAADDVQHHTVVYVLQECRVQEPKAWFVLDSSHLDGSHVLAY